MDTAVLIKVSLLMLAGGLGALSRYVLVGVIQEMAGSSFPLGTAAVNLLGCFLFGFIVTLIDERMILPPGMKPYLLTGFMGAFTTFSTYAFETASLIRYSQWVWAAANILGHTLLGLALLVLGMVLARAI
ncbi:MAG: fluoride efflux transporter CrcB [Deltaproteobacteria bacterium]|nr:MAG: fluoride efflux transporter CrcB [Deltaproteobacteria bacterium]